MADDSDGGFILTALVLTAGELASARSPREFKELAIMRNSIDLVFFFGVPFFMKLLSGSTTVAGALEKAQQTLKTLPKSAHAPALQQAASRSAWTYVLSFVLGSLAVAGITIATNQMTRKGVKKAAEALDTPISPQTTTLPSAAPVQLGRALLPPVTQALLSPITA